MNKKVIKYLIWSILITALLILTPVVQIVAEDTKTTTIKFTEFKTSKNLFCLNKGYPFGSEEQFKVESMSQDVFKEKFKKITTRDVDIDVLKYIISESDSGKYGDRTAIGNYIPQVAIWKLAGSTDFSDVLSDCISEANTLIANAYAYKNFIDAGSPVPTIEKYGTDGVAIKYYQATSTTDWGNGTYTNLLIDTISVTGANYSGEPLDIGNGWYKRIYTKNSGATEVTISFEYETRDANLTIYQAKRNTKPIIKYYISTIQIPFLNIGGIYYHSECNGYQEICYETKKNVIEEIIYNKYEEQGFKPVTIDSSILADYEADGYKFYSCEHPSHPILAIHQMEIKGPKFISYNEDRDLISNGITVTFYARELGMINSTTGYDPQNLLYGTGSISTENKSETIKLIQPVTLSFNKKDFSGNAVAGATLKVTAVENVESLSSGSITIGNGSVTVMPTNGNSGTFKIKLTETAPTGYKEIPEVTLTVSYNNGAVTGITSSNTTYVPNSSNSTVTVKNRPAVRLTFNKKDFSGKLLSGAKIEVTGNDKVSKIEGRDSNNNLTSNSNGSFGTITVYPSETSGQFKLNIKEKTAPTGYKVIPDTVLTVNYNKDTGTVTSISSDTGNYLANSGNTITVKNQPILNNLKIVKTDSLTPTLKIPGVTFRLELTGVHSITGYSGTPSIITATTDSKGEINLNGIVLATNATQITVKITETAVPDKTSEGYFYKVNSTPRNITITYNNGTWSVSGDSASISGNNTVNVGIQNTPYINLSGMVWEDGQTGEKGNVSDANGQKDSSEINLEGIIVELYSVKENKVIRTTKTDVNGNYSFVDIPKTNEGYKIIFKYNGITYVETPTGTISKPIEVNRDTFNNRFKTISAGKSNDNTALEYTYNSGNKTSALNATIDGHTTGTTNAKFQMSAQTATYTNITTNVSCGLVKKNFDLAIGTDVKEATLKINEKETKYTYAQIMNGELNGNFQNNSSTTENVIYNLYLYSSDYNYRIGDYKTDIGGNNAPNSDNNNVADYEGLKNLEAFVTYSVILKAQTTQNSTVEEFVYYYDAAYTPYNIVSTDKYNVLIDTNARKITFTSINDGFKLTSPNYRVEIDLTFKINKDANGNITTKTATNIAEITKYSTDEGGLIDKDSAPQNANITFTGGTPKVGKYEDDTDEAKGLNIELRTEETRVITGTVFDDTYKNTAKTQYDKDGKLNYSNTAVNDVIVQLIEIKKIGGQYYEYIWQETRSGSNQVKTTARNGYEGTTYTNSVQAGSGKYEFKGFIPGNYIIRYIYGDGTTYDVTDNIKTYNGQDYKSTKDPNYNKTWYNTSNYSSGSSIARDNEARRLEVMSYSATINKGIGNELKEKTALDKTWMCAETSRINIPVDADNKATTSNATTASYTYTKNGNRVTFGNMNFGLALRPQTNIVLEKHITALKITPSGTGVQSIVDAKALGIEKIVNGTEVEVQGVTTGLATIKSTAANRGFWQVATDVEELMQGAELEVEYTYVLRNDSEEDYLTSFLIEEYKKGIDNGRYSILLKTKAAEVKTATKGQTEKYGSYLGQFYYTGTKGTNDALVTSRVELFEEALNNDFIFDETEAISFKTTQESVNKKVYGVNKAEGTKDVQIDTVIQNKTVSDFLIPTLTNDHTTETADWSRTLKLKTTLATVSGGELGANLPSYIAEILQYSNAAGRKDMKATPANLGYVHSDDTTMTMANDNEQDEFWAESIIITKPTGEDKLTPLQIVIITISTTAILGVGIVLIKKFVLKK